MGIEPELDDGIANGETLSIALVQQLRIKTAGESSTADEWDPEPNALFFGEADDFNCVRQSPSRQSFYQRNRQQHAENAVVSPGVRHGVEVRTDQQSRRC